MARGLRGSTTPIVLVANKAEGRAGEAGVYEAMALGLGDPVQLSAEHGEGMGDLFAALLPHLDGKAIEAEDDDPENRSEEHTSELQSLMRISSPVLCLKKNNNYI